MTGQKVAAPIRHKGAEQTQQGKRPTGAALDPNDGYEQLNQQST